MPYGPPPVFVRAGGQAGAEVSFYLDGPELQAHFKASSITLKTREMRAQIQFAGASHPVLDGKRSSGKINLITGDEPSAWKTGLEPYENVIYHGLYNGIDAIYTTSGPHLKSEFRVSPYSNPDQIRLRYTGDGHLRIDPNGDLVLSNASSELREKAPEVYQQWNTGRVRVEAHYQLLGDQTVKFQIGPYNSSLPLIIDPVISYCSYIGGSGMGAITAVAVDSQGNLYMTGWTESLDFPISGAFHSSNGGGDDAFVIKLNASGNALIYATYIGGSGSDQGAGIAVDSSGEVYLTGSTSSSNFPLASPIQGTLGGESDAFVLKLSASGNTLIYSTYLGGSGWEQGTAIAIDASGNAYVAGDTQSTNFPVLNPVQTIFGGSTDAFVSKLNSSGAMAFSTYLGGSGVEHAGGIAVDANGSAYIAGSTYSTNFPIVNALYGANAGGQDAFVCKLGAAGNSIVYSTYLGGSSADQANAIALDSSNAAYVTGITTSANFPTVSGGLRTTYNGMQDSFVAKLLVNGATLAYSTYIGGSTSNNAMAIAVDPNGDAYITGSTSSVDFPTVNTLQPALGGNLDAFVAELNATASALVFSTFYGGSGSDVGNALALDPTGNMYVGGQTNSSDLPLCEPLYPSYEGLPTGWFLRIAQQVFIAPSSPSPNSGSTVSSLSPLLTWIESSSATSFQVYFGTSSTPPYVATTSALQYNPGFLAPATTYYWQVIGQSGQNSASSPVWLFTTPAAGSTVATHFMVTAPANATAGIPLQFTVTALTANNATATTFGDSVHFTSSDESATLPANATLTNGTGSFSASFVTAGSQTLTATDVLLPSVTGTSSSSTVTAPLGLRYIPVTPCRVVDTRNATGPFGGPIVSAGIPRSFTIPAGSCGIPATAQAYSFSVAVVPSTVLGYLTVWPTGQMQPQVATLNSLDGRIKSNAAIIPAGTGGAVSVYATNNTQVILDINGYFVPETTPGALAFYPVTPCRLVDTRINLLTTGALTAGETRTLPLLSSACNLPASAQAYSLNFTVVPPSGGVVAYITAFPAGSSLPSVATLNDLTGTIVANAAILPAGTSGSIDVYSTNNTDLVVDLNGYFAPAGTGGLSLYTLPPCRVLDTRQPPIASTFIGEMDVNVLGGACGATPATQAYVFNTTVVPTAALGYLTLWPQGTALPTVATLNALDGAITNNMAIVATNNTEISAYATNATALILDIFGYFAP